MICALFSEGNEGYNYLILSNEPDLRPLCKQLNQKLNGRGGGSKEMVSGSFKAAREEIEATLKEVLDAAD